MKLTLLLCAATMLQIAGSESADQFNLELVQVLFRHGERTPQKDEAKLITNASRSLEGPWGYAQLTNVGRRQEYRLGQLLREKYGDFLGDYRPEHVFACSSPFDRTKASLQLVLASLYPPEGELDWDEELKWQPVPIHFVPRELDMLFNSDLCPKFEKTYQNVMNSRELRAAESEYEDVFRFLCKIYPNIKFDLRQLFLMNNFLNIQASLGMERADWYSEELHERVRQGALLYLETLSYTPSLIRLNGGNLAKRMLENMNIDGYKPNPRKIYLYSGHEFTIYAVAKAHNITLQKSPAYSSAIVLEKLRDNNGDLFVRMYYMTGSEEEIPIKLNGYEYCPITEYLDLVYHSLPTDDESRCLYKNLKPADLERILNTDSYTVSD